MPRGLTRTTALRTVDGGSFPMATSNPTQSAARTLVGFGVVVAMLFGLMALTGTWVPRLGLDLRGGTTITLTARTSDGSSPPRENLETARTIIRIRTKCSADSLKFSPGAAVRASVRFAREFGHVD